MITVENKILPIIQEHKSGDSVGITSICSANQFVLKASIINAKKSNRAILIESTSNQVDQYGGYTGITPSMFRDIVYKIADDLDFPKERIILGGDHLGPNRWQNENSTIALEKAKEQIAAYISAGYTKIHLDASMKCADDGDPLRPLSSELIAERTALLCEVAERTYEQTSNGNEQPVYVIGSDVPPPGGAKGHESDIRITEDKDVEQTINLTKRAFEKHNLIDAWERVIAIVVQPGVEFGDASVIKYNREKALKLSKFISTKDNLVYEAHSTDYQSKESLREMVEGHFVILKVGPWLTFALREALFALSLIEQELLSKRKNVQLSNLIDIVDKQMINDPKYWIKYYSSDEVEQTLQRKFSYSDRIRYYWTDKVVDEAVKNLIKNLSDFKIPDTLISQFLPAEYDTLIECLISNNPVDLINHKIQSVLQFYNYATYGGAN
jgi:D-tagatose-1,6-bisphosphate aldolase subunit GatZ/KbaZ